MAIDTGRFNGFSSGTVSTTELNEHVAALEEYINGGIVSSDLQSSPRWVGHRHVDAADFYGSPAPRWEGVSKTVHHRYTGPRREDGALFLDDVAPNKWLAVPGLATVVRVNPQVSRTVGLEVAATWFTFEDDGQANYYASSFDVDPSALCATFALFIDDAIAAGTTRPLFISTNEKKKAARKHHSVTYDQLNLQPGVHDVCVKVKVQLAIDNDSETAGVQRYHKFIWVLSRVLTAKVIYL